MRRDLFIPAAAFAATVTTGLALIPWTEPTAAAAWSLIAWAVDPVGVIGGSAILMWLVGGVLTDRDRKRRVRETRGVWR